MWAWIGAFAGMAAVGVIADYVFNPSTFPTFFAAEGAAATLIYALPALPAGENVVQLKSRLDVRAYTRWQPNHETW